MDPADERIALEGDVAVGQVGRRPPRHRPPGCRRGRAPSPRAARPAAGRRRAQVLPAPTTAKRPSRLRTRRAALSAGALMAQGRGPHASSETSSRSVQCTVWGIASGSNAAGAVCGPAAAMRAACGRQREGELEVGVGAVGPVRAVEPEDPVGGVERSVRHRPEPAQRRVPLRGHPVLGRTAAGSPPRAAPPAVGPRRWPPRRGPTGQSARSSPPVGSRGAPPRRQSPHPPAARPAPAGHAQRRARGEDHQTDEPEERQAPGEVVDGRVARSAAHLRRGRHHHHQVGHDPVGPERTLGLPVREVRRLHQDRAADALRVDGKEIDSSDGLDVVDDRPGRDRRRGAAGRRASAARGQSAGPDGGRQDVPAGGVLEVGGRGREPVVLALADVGHDRGR